VAPGTFLREGVGARLSGTRLEPTRESGTMSLGLPTARRTGVVGRVDGEIVALARRGGDRRNGISRRDTRRHRAAVTTARLALRVGLRLGVGLALGPPQTPVLTQRRTDLAAADLADPAAAVGDRLLLLRRRRRLR
jgi:hypothetical protein